MSLHPAISTLQFEVRLRLNGHVGRQTFNEIHNAIRETPGVKSATQVDFTQVIKVVIDESWTSRVGEVLSSVDQCLISKKVPTNCPVYIN